jgi:hypothetical protein
MNARRLALTAVLVSLPSFGCERPADAAESTSTGASNTSRDAAALRRSEIAAMGLDELIVAETKALERTADLLASVEDRAAAETVAARLADVQREVAALAERRAALTKDHALPKNRLAYAMQREHLARTEVRITNELQRLAAIEGVRDEIEGALTPILDVFLTTAR